MDNISATVLQVGATVVTVGLGFWRVHEKLRDRIDGVGKEITAVKDEIAQDRVATTAVKGAVDLVGSKVDNFTNLCAAHRGSLEDRIKRMEKCETP